MFEAGFGNLVGTDPELIFRKAVERSRSIPPLKENPFGSGDASSRILDFLEAALDAHLVKVQFEGEPVGQTYGRAELDLAFLNLH